MKIGRLTGVALIAGVVAASGARAQDLTVYGGITATTNYVFRSVTFSDDQPAIQPYIEAEINGFYAGIWASNADFGPGTTDDFEVDYYLGYRGETPGGFSYDINYARFTFDDTGNCCGELNLNLGLSVTDTIGLSTAFAYDPDAETLASGLGASYAITDALSISGTFGHDEVFSHNYWDVGVNYGLNEKAALDVRYFDTSSGDSIVALALSYDTTLFSR